MRRFAVAAVLGLLLSAAPSFAQAPAAPAAPPVQAPAPAPQVPFPAGAKYAFINIQRIANESGEGRAATARVQALNQQKLTELNERNKAVQANQLKLEQGGSVLSDAARLQLEREIERQSVDIQRFTEDAQAEVQALQAQLQADFQQRLSPVIQRVAQERNLEMLFSVADSGIVWANPGLDLTNDVIQAFDTGAGAPAAGAPPAAPAPAAPQP
ncbi:MAG: OmpH family outer membrane protein [Acidobacteria bacterium]|nr:OmpH family outer membrane protein [Acidobacteriota bacterium]